MFLNKCMIAVAAGLTLASAQASTLYTLDTTLQGQQIAASAEFEWSGSTLTLTLANDTPTIAFTIQELTGIHFTLSGAPVLLDVTGVAQAGTANCVGVAANEPCNFDSTAVDPFSMPPDLDGNGAAPTGWAALPSLGLFTFGAGNGSWKPFGIVNTNIVGTGTGGNTSNLQHNPFLVGPVVFTLTFGQFDVAPNITGVDFYWGTSSDHRAGSLCTTGDCGIPGGDTPVPEPGSVALLAIALLAASRPLRRRSR